MSRRSKVFLVAIPIAILLSAACRFIYHTDREYSQWVAIYEESAAWLEARCAELQTPGACATARDRRSFLTAIEAYRDRITAWWWPALAATLSAWIAAIVSFLPINWRK